MPTLALTENAINLLAGFAFDDNWLLNPQAIDELPTLRTIRQANTAAIFTTTCTQDAKLLVIAGTDGELFSHILPEDRRGAYDRCVRIALRGFGQQVTLNPRWMPFHLENKVSVFAAGPGNDQRLLAEVKVDGSPNVLIYALGDKSEFFDLRESHPHYGFYRRAVQLVTTAISDNKGEPEGGDVDGLIELKHISLSGMTRGFSYSEWYPKLLTKDQLRFVNHKLAGPLRLRGSAGTGKTLAMIIKSLKTKYDAEEDGEILRILFITHSWATAEHIDKLISEIDDKPETASTIDVFPLLLLANKRDYSRIGRSPLGIDSQEGKALALREIADVLRKFRASDWYAFRSGCSAGFIERIEAEQDSRAERLLCWDLLVEFGCVIAAQGILTHASDKEKYLRVRRMKWMLYLDNASEREAVFALWREFMNNLRIKGLISTDQIMSDYLNDLSTFYWEAARRDQGYDIVFVDEMHLFNSQERLVFHNLLSDGDTPPKVVMALDPKQSPRETFTNVEEEGLPNLESIFDRARLPKPDKIDLNQVFRYTPEISNLIAVVHEAAPGLDLVEDWDVPLGVSSADHGRVPRLLVAKNELDSFKNAMELAAQSVKTAAYRDGRVAVLCMDEDRFSKYKRAVSGQYGKTALLIASRDDTEKLKYFSKRIVFSTPEYVAGLQFDTVIILDANKNQVPEGKNNSFHLRRFLSELYLGMSRAQQDLFIIASQDEGGVANVLERAVASGLLEA